MALGALAVVVALTTACEPQPPPATFEVTSDATGGDLAPGDGTCEATAGVGDCTLQAAVDEADAGAEGVVVLTRALADHPSLSADITGAVTIRFEVAGAVEHGTIDDLDITVAPGGSLTVEDVEPGAGTVEVAGSLVLDRSALPGGLVVRPGGTAVLRNVLVAGGVANGGTVAAVSSTIVGHGSAALTTTGAGITHLAATAVLAEAGVPACAGTAPVSAGHNAATDASCALTATGDVEDDVFTGSNLFPELGSPRVDAIPVGAAGCGSLAIDIRGFPRPTDGDGDGVVACDIGAWER